SFSQPNPTRYSDLDPTFYTQPLSSSPPQYAQRDRRPRCPECGTRKMRLSAGQLICKRGHVQQNFRVEQTDDDGFLGDGVARQRRTRTTTKVRKLKSQHTPHHSFPDTDVEPDDSDDASPQPGPYGFLRGPRGRSASAGTPSAALMAEDDIDDGFETDFTANSELRRRDPGPRSIWRTGVGLHGTFDGRFSALQCLQLVLRLQLHALRRIWKDRLPPQTEAVARDLWAMLVSQLPLSNYPPEPLIAATFDWHTRSEVSQEQAASLFPDHPAYDPEKETQDHRKRMLFGRFCADRRRAAADGNSAEYTAAVDFEQTSRQIDDILESTAFGISSDAAHGKRAHSEVFSDVDDEPPDPEDQLAELDPIFAEQRRQRRRRDRERRPENDRDDDDDSEDDLDEAGATKRKGPPRRWATRSALARQAKLALSFAKLPSTISIIYLSLWLLKVPILWTDLTSLVLSFQLPYLNVVHQLPLPLTRLLNRDDVHTTMLDVDQVPLITTFHQHTLQLAHLLNETYGVAFGEGNQSGILVRLVRGMGLPPTFYVATRRVLSMLEGVSSSLCRHEDDPLRNKDQQPAKVRHSTVADTALLLDKEPKEFVLLAALLVVVKMRYGFDGRSRYEELRDPASLQDDQEGAGSIMPEKLLGGLISCAPDLQAWMDLLESRAQRAKSSATTVWDLDHQNLSPLDMSMEQIEAYADFAEQHLVLPNQLELYDWRRREARAQWSSFADFLAPESDPANTAAASGAGKETEQSIRDQDRKELEKLYRNHPVRPGAPGEESSDAQPCGSSYPSHTFTTDPSGVAYTSLYPRLLGYANTLVGAQQVGSGLEYAIARTNGYLRAPRRHRPPLEHHFGVAAHLELVEDVLSTAVGRRSRVVEKLLRATARD
ncbi:hypothetical protein BCV70DRAFT_143319, partial [Testicularia cyperi]